MFDNRNFECSRSGDKPELSVSSHLNDKRIKMAGMVSCKDYFAVTRNIFNAFDFIAEQQQEYMSKSSFEQKISEWFVKDKDKSRQNEW